MVDVDSPDEDVEEITEECGDEVHDTCMGKTGFSARGEGRRELGESYHRGRLLGPRRYGVLE